MKEKRVKGKRKQRSGTINRLTECDCDRRFN